jgi:WD40 repeat protein
MRLNLFSCWWKPLCAAFVCLACLGAGPWRQPDVQAHTNSQPSTQPFLRIETGMHTAIIRGIGVDAAGRYLVTGSDDKTARVWELATGRMLRALRPPLGNGNEGKIYAVAVSPAGRIIAAGGWTSSAGSQKTSTSSTGRAGG